MPNGHMINPRFYILQFRNMQNGDLENKFEIFPFSSSSVLKICMKGGEERHLVKFSELNLALL